MTRPSSSIIASPQPSSSSATGSSAAVDVPAGSTVAADVPGMLADILDAPQPSSSKPLNPENNVHHVVVINSQELDADKYSFTISKEILRSFWADCVYHY